MLLSKINNYMAYASHSCCGSEELLEGSVVRSSCCWWRDLDLLSIDLSEPWGMQIPRQSILLLPSISPRGSSPPLSLHGRREHMAAYLCSCCSYVLSGLKVPRGLGGFAQEEGEEGGCRRWAAPDGSGAVLAVSRLSSVACHLSDWIAASDCERCWANCLVRDQEMVTITQHHYRRCQI